MILIDLSLLIVFLAMAKVLGGKALAIGKVEMSAIDAPFYFELGTGLAIVSSAIFFIGVTVGFKGLYFQIAALAVISAWYKEIILAVREGAASFGEIASERDGAAAKVLLILLLVSVISNICFNYAPPAEGDELAYHLNLPHRYLIHGGIFNIPEISLSYLFLTLDLLYIPLMAVKSVFAAKLLSVAFGILDMALVYLLAREFAGKRCALLAAVLFYTTPMTTGLAGVGKIDAGVTFYSLLALWSFLKYSGSGPKAENTWFILFSVCSGILMASKATGPFFVAAFTIMLAAVLIAKKRGFAGTVKTLFLYGSAAMLFVLPWLVKNMLWTGNPLYPAKIWSRLPYDETFAYIVNTTAPKPAIAVIKDYFFGFITGPGYVIAAFLPLYLIIKDKKKGINAMLVFSALLASILSVSGYALDLTRYTYSCYAVFAVVCAYTITVLSDADPRLKRIVTAMTLVMILVPNVCMGVYFGAKRVPYILGFQSADQYLQKQYEFEGWETVKWIGKNIPPDARICYLGSSWPIGYYYGQTMIAGNRPSILRYSLSEAKTYLKKSGIGYIILCGDRYTEANGVLRHSLLSFLNVYWFEGTSIDREFDLIYSNKGTRVYKVRV